MAAITNNSKTNRIVIFSRTAKYVWLKFCMEYLWDLDADWHQNEKKSVAELGHNGHLKIYVDPKKYYVSPGI